MPVNRPFSCIFSVIKTVRVKKIVLSFLAHRVGEYTLVDVSEHVFMGRSMRVVVHVTDDDSQRVGAADWRTTAVPDDHRDVVRRRGTTTWYDDVVH